MLLTTLALLTAMAGQDLWAPPAAPPPGQQASRWAGTQPANAPPLARETDCQNPANRAEGESENACVFRFRRMGPTLTVDLAAYAEEVRRRDEAAREAAGGDTSDFDAALVASYAAPEGPAVPEWAFLDRARWERTQCGAEADEACLRTARNRLALARAERPAAAPPVRPAAGQDRCRNVWRRAEEGVGGSFTRVCGDDEGAGAQLLEDMRRRDEQARQDAERDCVRRPVTTDQGVRWTLECGSRENRERADDRPDGVTR